MARKRPPSFDFFPGDFMAGTLGMELAEVGAYIRLLCYQWEHETLPNDERTLARIAGAFPDEFSTIWPNVKTKFISTNGEANSSLYNERLEAERQKKQEISEKRAAAAFAMHLQSKQGCKKHAKGSRKKEEGSRKKRKKEDGSQEDGKWANEISQIWEYYKTYRSMVRVLGPKTKSKIKDRLQEGSTVDDIKKAIDGNFRSPHHCGENKTGTEYHDLELIVRDTEHLNMFLQMPAKPRAADPRGNMALIQRMLEDDPD